MADRRAYSRRRSTRSPTIRPRTRRAERSQPSMPPTVAAPSDVERCLDIADFMGLGCDDRLYVITIPGPPWSKARPRFSRGRTYSSRDDIDAEIRTGLYLKNSIKTIYTGNVGVGCLFYRQNRQRIDTDNLLKHVCDSANGIIWIDDYQCTSLFGAIELDPENPRTVVVVGAHETTMTRGTDAYVPCVVCEGPIYLDKNTGKLPKTCSPKCRESRPGAPGSLRQPVPCKHCGKPFKRTNHTSVLCSTQCRKDWITNKHRAESKPFSRCIDCNTELAHKRGGRCRNCWRANFRKDLE